MTTLQPQFGISIEPSVGDTQEPFGRAQLADELGLDLITLMDHPYNVQYLETWTLLSGLAMATRRVHLMTNVANLPLRPPAMLAKQAATLDVLSRGRLELGLGAGAYWKGISAFGGPERSPGEAYQAFEDALHILRGLWDNAGSPFSYEGEVYEVTGARLGPEPAHRIPIWVGASGPRMLRLTGRMADGIIVSNSYEPPERLLEINDTIDEGAAEASRQPSDIRRGYNLMGSVQLTPGSRRSESDNGFHGSVGDWIEHLIELYEDYQQDTFIFWPSGSKPHEQIKAFAREVIPSVRQALGAA